MNVCMYACMHACMPVCMCVSICANIHLYLSVHTLHVTHICISISSRFVGITCCFEHPPHTFHETISSKLEAPWRGINCIDEDRINVNRNQDLLIRSGFGFLERPSPEESKFRKLSAFRQNHNNVQTRSPDHLRTWTSGIDYVFSCSPKAPICAKLYTWAFEALLYPDFAPNACTVMLLGASWFVVVQVISFSAAMSACEKGGEWRQAVALLDYAARVQARSSPP